MLKRHLFLPHPATLPARLALALLLACAWLLLPAAQILAEPRPAPTPAYERLDYDLSWKTIYVGHAVLETNGTARYQTTPALHFSMTTRTNAFVDWFFKVRNRLDAWVRPDYSSSLKFSKDIREGSARRRLETTFFPEQGTATFTPHEDTVFPDAPPASARILPGTTDPLGVFFLLRQRPFPENRVLQAPISDGKRFDYAVAVDRGPVEVRIMDNTLACRDIEVRMNAIDGILRLAGPHAFHVLITDDAARIPVRIESPVRIGPFQGLLRVTLSGRTAAP